MSQIDDTLGKRTKGVLFGLCYFHAIMLERAKFGPIGFNAAYPFSTGDLVASASLVRNYMETTASLPPWDDLRYMIGEILYGGHIVNDMDRRLCMAYLEFFLRDSLLDEMELLPFVVTTSRMSFRAPACTSAFTTYLEDVDASLALASESPLVFGLHPNAELGYRTDQTYALLSAVHRLQVRVVVASLVVAVALLYRHCSF